MSHCGSLGWAIIQAVAFFYDRSEGAHYIGTATSEQGAATYVRIWKAAGKCALCF